MRRYRDLYAWQLADAFCAEVNRLIELSGAARLDTRYRDQLLGAAESVASNVAEGFLRFSSADFSRFLSYALGSLGEAESRLRNGVRREYFHASEIAAAETLARRTLTAIVRRKRSLPRPE